MTYISVTLNTYCWIQVKYRGFPHYSSVNKLFSYWLICEGGVVYLFFLIDIQNTSFDNSKANIVMVLCGQTNVNSLDLVSNKFFDRGPDQDNAPSTLDLPEFG